MVVTFVTKPTTITANADSRQQFIGHDVTITGRLTAEGAALAAVPVTYCLRCRCAAVCLRYMHVT